MEFLTNYNWPGNVRELINVIYNLAIFIDAPYIELSHLEKRQELFRVPISELSKSSRLSDLSHICTQIDKQELSLANAKQEFEKLQIERALKICNGQITSASYMLQMPRPQVSRLIKKYNIDKEEFKL